MTTLREVKQQLKKHKPYLAKKYKVKKIGIFGSLAYGKAKKNSDIDILVDFRQPIGFEFVDLADDLEKILHHKVDLVSKNGIKKNYFQYVKKDLIYV